MRKICKIKNNRLIHLFVILFLTLSLITVIVGGISCIYTAQTVKDVVTEYNVSNIENVRSILDMNVAAGEKLAQDICLSIKMNKFKGDSIISSPENIFLISNLIKAIEYGVDRNGIITNAYIYLTNEDKVISNRGFFDADFYYENYVPHAGLTAQQWKESMQSVKEPTYEDVVLKYEAYEQPAIEYKKAVYSLGLYGCVVIQYDNESILRTLKRSSVLSGASTQIRYIPQDRVLAQTGSQEINEFVREHLKQKNRYILEDDKAGELVIIRQTSQNQEWEYISAIPAQTFYKRMNTLVAIMISVVIAQCIVGIVLAVFFSARGYRPINEMTNKIRNLAQDVAVQDSADDIDYIQKITAKAIEGYGTIKNQLEIVRPLVLKGFLLQLMRGNGAEQEYIKKQLKEKNELFRETGFLCVKIGVEECSEFAKEESIEEMQLVKLVVSNITEEILAEYFTVITTDYDLKSIVVVINIPFEMPPEEKNKKKELLEDRLKYSQTIIEDRFRIYTGIGISRLQEGLESLYVCHRQANQALMQKNVSEMYGVTWYEERDISNEEYNYSIEDEIGLLNYTKTGDKIKVKTELERIIGENQHILQGTMQIAQCFVLDLASTLLRAEREMNIPDDVLNFDVHELLEKGSYRKMLCKIEQGFENACDWSNKNKKSHNIQTKERIERYIQEHYLDNSLSLVSVADHLELNPTYLSAFIKEQFGETFLSYVLGLRMEKAKEYLRTTNDSLQEIAVKIGYANSGVFIRVFKKKFGYTPGMYRTDETL